jgi:hypothetical protein
MDAHLQQQFDFLLNAAIERFVERCEQRCGGPVPALARLRDDPNADGVWVDEFVQALFRDFLLDSPDGAAFVLQALAKRPLPVITAPATSIGAWMQQVAARAFGDVLARKTDEALEHRLAFQVTD